MEKIIKIENDIWQSEVSSLGAELFSLKRKSDNREFIWQRDKAVWASSSPVLFPIVGGLRDNLCRLNGSTYPMAKHGVLRKSFFDAHSPHSGEVEFVFPADEKSKAAYPYDFDFRSTYTLLESGLKVSFEITNNDEKTMPFNLGSHPAFNIDLENYSHEDYYVVFADKSAKTIWSPKNDLLVYRPDIALKEGEDLQIGKDIFNKDCLVFRDESSAWVELRNKKSAWKVRMEKKGWTSFGVWAKPGAPFVCLEPWLGYNDIEQESGDFLSKAQLVHLEPGQTFALDYKLLPS